MSTPDELERSYHVLLELRTGLSRGDFKELRAAAGSADGYKLVGAYDEGECVGVMGYRVLHDFVHGKHLYIDDLVVTAKRRSKGVGAAFLTHAEEVARDLGCKGLRLCTGIDAKDAQRFYEKNGWKLRAVAYKKSLV